MKRRPSRLYAAALVLGAILAAPAAIAATPGCPDAKTFSSGAFMSDLCWSCMFPMQIGVAAGDTFPQDAAAPVCVCPSAALMGVPTPGISVGMWQPNHLVETVRKPGCFPSIGSSTGLASTLSLLQGGGQEKPDDTGYHSTHIYTFPVGAMTDMLTSSVCTTTASYDVDITSMSEIDPTHSDPMLSMTVNPEATLFANVIAQAVCIADSLASSVGRPLLNVYWCMGSWGNTYPLTGHNTSRSRLQSSGLNGSRSLATFHKRGMGYKTYGDSAVCASHTEMLLPKQQYKYQVLYPMPQKDGNDWMGRSTLLSREWRHLPIVGEDWVQVLSNYVNCCVHIP